MGIIDYSFVPSILKLQKTHLFSAADNLVSHSYVKDELYGNEHGIHPTCEPYVKGVVAVDPLHIWPPPASPLPVRYTRIKTVHLVKLP